MEKNTKNSETVTVTLNKMDLPDMLGIACHIRDASTPGTFVHNKALTLLKLVEEIEADNR